MIHIYLTNTFTMETEAGLKSEGQAQTLQNRVRDAFRKGLQWKWERETGSAFGGSRSGVDSQGHATSSSPTQKHWPQFAPVAIQRFRRLFSSDATNNVPLEQTVEVYPKSLDEDDVKLSNSVCTSIEYHNAAQMVKVETQYKKIQERQEVEPVDPNDDSAAEEDCLGLKASGKSTCQPSFTSGDQDCIPQATLTPMSSSTMEAGLSVGRTDNMKSVSSQSLKVVETKKASDEQPQSLEVRCSSYSKSIDCDLGESKSLVLDSPFERDNTEAAGPIKKTKVTDGNNIACPDNGSISGVVHHMSKGNIFEERNEIQILQSKDNAMANSKASINPSIVLSEIDSSKTFDKHSESATKPLFLKIDTSNCGGTHARKSPVTVQEWVDSIPLSSHLEEDLEHGDSAADSSLNARESNEPAGPSSSIRPPPTHSSSAAGQRREAFSRDASPSLQSDTGSHGSSVDSFLEARRPDPEEVLLGLGFGGPLHSAEAEVSRIPARFLQPSKVKGVAIDDFLRYQQDLIETFESGHSGYRGLTGGAQIPSVIVAKIMEKLREHERESSIKSSAGSSPGHHADISKRRFSRAAHRVTILTKMKSRDSIASGPQAHSVLNPDNRKFLDNQGSKSPEVSRKRMVIGHRSFTFDGEGHLIETETTSEEGPVLDLAVPQKPLLPRPLIHKDSVLSSATSLSLTSCDSDSDTDEASTSEKNNIEIGSGGKLHGLSRLLSTPVSSESFSMAIRKCEDSALEEDEPSSTEKRRLSLPCTSGSLVKNLSPLQLQSTTDTATYDRSGTTSLQTSTPQKTRKDFQRVNSAPTISPLSSPNLSLLEAHKEEVLSTSQESNGRNENHNKYSKRTRSSLIPSASPYTASSQVSSPQSLTSSGSLPYYQISDFDLPNEINSPLNSPGCQSTCSVDNVNKLQRTFSLPKSAAVFLDEGTCRKLSLNSSVDSYAAINVAQSPDLKHWSTSSVSSWESEKDPPPNFGMSQHFSANLSQEHQPLLVTRLSDPDVSTNITRRRGSLKRQPNVDEEESVALSSFANLTINALNAGADKGDSFEMEELAVEDEVRGTRVGSAHSDSSGFQDEPHSNKEIHPRTALRKQLSESEPMLHMQPVADESGPTYSAEHLKRFSLPVIRVQDESGLIQWRASSVGEGNIPYTNSLRRVQSLPSQISHLGLGRLGGSISPGSIADSIGNMFSSCSDESVIHVPETSSDITQELHPLQVAITECCKCNCSLKKSLSVCHSDLAVSPQVNYESLKRIGQGLQTLREAQVQLGNTMQQVQDQLCSFPDCTVGATMQQVAMVIQQQNNLCLQLEHLSSSILASVNISSMQSQCDTPNPSPIILESDELQLKDSQNHSGKCKLLCQVVETENRRLQDLVRMNFNELTQVRGLLERLIPNANSEH